MVMLVCDSIDIPDGQPYSRHAVSLPLARLPTSSIQLSVAVWYSEGLVIYLGSRYRPSPICAGCQLNIF